MQSNNTTTETPKLKISETITHTERVEKSVSLPYFFKDVECGYLCKVVSNEHFILVDNSSNWWSARVRPVKSYLIEVAKGLPITEDEFEAAYENALMCVQTLKENAGPSHEHDENEEIDQIIERRAS